MIKRTIEISGKGNHLAIDQGALAVRLLRITDKQYERMRVFWGKRRKPTEQPPRQLELF